MKRGFILIAVISVLFWQCSETMEIDPSESGTEYFPLQIGTYRIYQVRGVVYNFAEDSVEFSYLMKESVVDSFQNLESGISYKIQRQKKYNENDPWEIDSIWMARVDNKTAVRIEHNVPIVSLTFPLKESKTWDGNKLNGKSEKEFKMINVGEPYSDIYGSHEKTVTVIQEYFPDVIVKNISEKEIYSKKKGLVYKENIKLIYKQDKPEENIFYPPQTVDTSLGYYQHLIDYGEE